MISRRLRHLQEIVQEYPLRKKVLISRSYAVGHQWLERLCREYGQVRNIEVATPYSLARHFSKLSLREKGLKVINSDAGYWIIHRLMHNIAIEEAQPYVPLTMLLPGVVSSFHSAVNELRQAMIRAESLVPKMFESAAKGEYIRKLLERYEQHLEQHGLADAADMLLHVESDPKQDPSVYIMDRHLQLSEGEQEALHIIAGVRLLMLDADAPFTMADSDFPAEDVHLFHALGPVAEVREVFRRLAEYGIPLDQAEVIVPDVPPYTSIVYTMVCQYNIACTFARGIPIEYTALGQAVRLYLHWLESGYHLDPILQALKMGLMCPATAEEALTNDSYIDVLEKSGIGWGRERYRLLAKMAVVPPSGNEMEAPPAKRLTDWFSSWFACLPSDDSNWTPGVVAAGLELMLKSVPVRGEDDVAARTIIRRVVETLRCADVETMERSLAIRYVREWMKRLTFGANGIPAEGKLYISSLRDGGQSGRPYTFIIGMDEKSWEISTSQDPILLDEERQRISTRLGTSNRWAEHEAKARAERLGAIRGCCTMSFSSYRIANKEERNAAFELLMCYRRQSGKAAAGYEDLFRALPPAVGMLYSNGRITLDSQEAWLKALVSGEYTIRDGMNEVLAAYPSLQAGQCALQRRKEPAIGEYDGVFDPAHYDPVPLMTNVSKMELFAQCPLKYFFQEILQIRPKEQAVFDRSQWLNAAQRGTLLHKVFQCYWMETGEQDGKHDKARLEQVTEMCLQRAMEEIPAPNEHVMRKEIDHIRRDVAIFWKAEKRSSSRPRYIELQLHGADKPFEIKIEERLTLYLRGYVDRVDELAPHIYKIIDYKTGSSSKYREDAYFAGGTQLQHAIYATGVERWLRYTGRDSEARVMEFAYYFPTFRGQGREIVRTQSRVKETERLVGNMLATMRSGIFPPTRDSRQCSWCKYNIVCGQHAEFIKVKRNDPSNVARIYPLTEVESCA
ncbi:PD-(D/E)XK nuclease family protein [Paenibacillus elgii]|uniref:PD-(D/E)XK nuclease family protein n=1 Tax=Paenibacillus elgii TaxID=189691 RepID=UPI002D7CDB6D|nr:PD-(D/E)XK nuclease family protein [Paenibacillus elgii]